MVADDTNGSSWKDLLPKGAIKNPCVFIDDPEEDCYCAAMNSVKSEATIYFCGEHFEECPVYKRRMRAQGA